MRSSGFTRCLLAIATMLCSGFHGTYAFNLSPSLYSSHTALSAACQVNAGAVRHHRDTAKVLFGPVMQLSAARKGGKGGKKGGKGGKGKKGGAAAKSGEAPRQTSQNLDTDKREYIYQVQVLPMQASPICIGSAINTLLLTVHWRLQTCWPHGKVTVRRVVRPDVQARQACAKREADS